MEKKTNNRLQTIANITANTTKGLIDKQYGLDPINPFIIDHTLDESLYFASEKLCDHISAFRALMGMSKKDFATNIHASRMTVDKIENGYMTPDLGYKLFYITYKVSQNAKYSNAQRLFAKNLMDRIEREIICNEALICDVPKSPANTMDHSTQIRVTEHSAHITKTQKKA